VKGGKSMLASLKKFALSSVGAMLCAVAVVFAQAPCHGLLYEPEVPEELK